MNKFLLTWYGITDFRASLGFENTDGPIAGALAGDSYTHVVILGYTRPDDDPSELIEAQKTFAHELASIRDAGQDKDWKATNQFVSRFANTAVAHEYFEAWLKSKVVTLGCNTSVRLKSEKLRQLNDTEGIYAGAMRALDEVERESGEKFVTLYLSPGTPVMAFVWALAALSYPELKKRLIASSVVGKAPEAISLPAEWLERHSAKQDAIRDIPSGFDVTFHLFGEQRMPALLSIRQFESEHHIFVNSKDYPATCMRAFLGSRDLHELSVDPWDDRAVHVRIAELAKQFPEKTRIGINLTGGTKLMFAGALSAARELGAIPFYFDSKNRRITFVDSLRREKIRPIDSIETFLLLNSDGLDILDSSTINELSSDRQILTKTLWIHRDKLRRFYKELTDYNNAFKPFEICRDGFIFKLDNSQTATIQGYGLDLVFEKWPDFAKYLSGGWFEEFVYLQCKPYEDTGVIQDLRINLKLNLKQENTWSHSNWGVEYNELDITFTDGYSLYIVECKAGNVTQEQVMKLQNLVRFYGGIEGRGIVACCVPPNTESAKKKIKDARLMLWSGASLAEQIKTLMDSITARAEAIEGTT
ncbi:Card1-like endonuclease domain-containing protein [Stenotrophomonas pavanii]|uniref:Card1-like endonuclease domain-containing protein n=1 Tax=Stenotrophomonas pavanii TaxID=487698 RepID=UPI0039C5F195